MQYAYYTYVSNLRVQSINTYFNFHRIISEFEKNRRQFAKSLDREYYRDKK